MSKSRRPLTLESLESRQLMHADVSLGQNGVLLIEADPGGGTVQVSNFWGLLRVNSRTEEGSQTNYFSRPSVKQIVFRGSENDDEFTNNTVIPSMQFGNGGNDKLRGGSGRDVIFGGDGNDWIWGGAGDDRLYGGRGNDVIFGGAGNDQIWGGDGNDFLFGEAGDDSLYGGGGNDWLFGGDGNDSLYGGRGNDWLFGGDGNDGLFGGEGSDVLIGGAGADRFLQRDGAADSVRDARSEDAVIRFRDAGRTSQFGVTWAAGQFTDREIEQIDSALRVLHHRTGNTALLKLADGTSLIFARQSRPSGHTNVNGWNDHTSIHLVPASFSSDDWLHQVIYHEIGHNWDEARENADIARFRAISGWIQLPANLGMWTSAGLYKRAENNWWCLVHSNYATHQSDDNPLEDFATSFAAYFMDVAGRPHAGLMDIDGMPDKARFINKFVGSLA